MELTDLATIRTLCEKYDFALSKGFGQNFIVNPGVPPKIVDAAGIDRSFGVLEIGPGIGVLTKEIAKRAGKVVAIEVDKRLPPVLEETLAGFDNVKVILQDVLKANLPALMAQEFAGMPVAVCANLPYYITSPIIMKLLEDRLPIQNITVMVQKEAAERLAALPGTRASGAVSCAVRYFAQPKMMFTVQAGSFYPAPKVTSAVVRLDIRPTPRRGRAGRKSLLRPGAGGFRSAPQDRRQCHRRRSGPAPPAGGGRAGRRRPGPPGPPRTADAGTLCRAGRRPAGRRAVCRIAALIIRLDKVSSLSNLYFFCTFRRERRRKTMGLTLNDRKEIAKRWAEGESAASIATRLGFATGTIYTELERGKTGKLDRNSRPQYDAARGQAVYQENLRRRGNRRERRKKA